MIKICKAETRFGGYPTYQVIMDGELVGTVRQISHNRFGDRWKAYDTLGKSVCESTTRKHAVAGLVDAAAWST